MIDLANIPALPQRQDSVSDQLNDMHRVANRLGLYDAADALKQVFGDQMDKTDIIRYGCHCDLAYGQEPDGCVIDVGERHLCIYAKKHDRKEQCEFWKIIAKI